MNLVWHIVKKDLRRLGLPLVLWTLVLVGKIGIGVRLLAGMGVPLESSGPDAAGTTWFEGTTEWLVRMQIYQNLLIGVEMVACYMLVAALLHDDPLIGTHMFWRSRPISGGQLLGAKLLGAALMFGVLPLLIWLPWWLYSAYGWREVLQAAPETLACNSAVVMTAMLVAVLTDNLTRFLTWTLVFVVTVLTVLLALEASRPDPASGGPSLAGLIETREMAAIAVALLTMTAVVGWQFLGRTLRGSFGVIAVGAALIVSIDLWWPWDGSKYWSPKDNTPRLMDSPALTRDVVIALAEAQLVHPRDSDKSTDHDSPRIFTSLVVHGVPPGFGLSFLDAKEAWRWPDGVTVRYSAHRYGDLDTSGFDGAFHEALGLPVQALNPDFVKWLSARRVRRGWLPMKVETGGERILTTGKDISPSVAARMLVESPAYSLTAEFGLMKPEVLLANVSLLDRTRHRFGSQTLRITHASVGLSHRQRGDESSSSELLDIIESRATSWREGFRELFPASFTPSREGSGWYLVNRARGNLSWNGNSGNGEGGNKIRIGTVEIAWRHPRFDAAQDWVGDGKWKDEQNWFEGVTLAIATSREVAHFERELKVPKLEVKPPTELTGEEAP